MKIYRKLLILVVLLISLNLHGQYNEKKILLDNADKMMKIRKYELARGYYKEALAKFPQDQTVIVKMLELHVKTSQSKSGEKLLAKSKAHLTDSQFTTYSVTFSLMEHFSDRAFETASKYLGKDAKLFDYLTMANLFQKYRSYDEAIEIFLDGEDKFPQKFTYKLAEVYYQSKQFKKAVHYFLKTLTDEKKRASMVRLRVRNIVNQHPKAVGYIEDYIDVDYDKLQINDTNMAIYEIFVDALLDIGDVKKATLLLEQFPLKTILAKGDQYKRLKLYDITIEIYKLALTKEQKFSSKENLTLKLAEVAILVGKYTFSDSLLINVIDGAKGNKRTLFQSYLLKADILRKTNNLSSEYLKALEMAESFSYNNRSKSDILSEISYFYILNKDLKKGEKNLKRLKRYGVTDETIYVEYLLALTTNSTAIVDSLSMELIVAYPGSERTKDMLEYKYLIRELNPKQQVIAFDAFREERLFNLNSADSLYTILAKETENNFFLIKSGDMYRRNLKLNRAKEIYSRNYQDEFCRDYAAMQLVLMEEDNKELKLAMARNFLISYPKSTFASTLRLLLNEESQ